MTDKIDFADALKQRAEAADAMAAGKAAATAARVGYTREDLQKIRDANRRRLGFAEPPTQEALKREADYASLRGVLERAIDQASRGKGRDRHASGEPFEQQRIVTFGLRNRSTVFNVGQVCKKAEESLRLPRERAVSELLGAINYLAGGVLILESCEVVSQESAKVVSVGEVLVPASVHMVETQRLEAELASMRRLLEDERAHHQRTGEKVLALRAAADRRAITTEDGGETIAVGSETYRRESSVEALRLGAALAQVMTERGHGGEGSIAEQVLTQRGTPACTHCGAPAKTRHNAGCTQLISNLVVADPVVPAADADKACEQCVNPLLKGIHTCPKYAPNWEAAGRFTSAEAALFVAAIKASLSPKVSPACDGMFSGEHTSCSTVFQGGQEGRTCYCQCGACSEARERRNKPCDGRAGTHCACDQVPCKCECLPCHRQRLLRASSGLRCPSHLQSVAGCQLCRVLDPKWVAQANALKLAEADRLVGHLAKTGAS